MRGIRETLASNGPKVYASNRCCESDKLSQMRMGAFDISCLLILITTWIALETLLDIFVHVHSLGFTNTLAYLVYFPW